MAVQIKARVIERLRIIPDPELAGAKEAQYDRAESTIRVSPAMWSLLEDCKNDHNRFNAMLSKIPLKTTTKETA